MDIRRRSLRVVTLALVVALPLLGTSGLASAKVKAKGCHKTHTCESGGGSSTGSGSGGASAPITVQIDPNPLVETGSSEVVATVQVETSPSFAGDAVNIDSSQLSASCFVSGFESTISILGSSISVVLDNDGNATAFLVGNDCAPGSDVVEADLEVAPFYTALATLDVLPPVVTPLGVTGYPTTSGTITTGEVETGDTPASGDSKVYAVFYVESDPVYAEQKVEISSAQLEGRCIGGWEWGDFTGTGASGKGVNQNPPATGILDDDGNAVFIFLGSSCATGTSEVIADVLSGSHPTYMTIFTVNPPEPTI